MRFFLFVLILSVTPASAGNLFIPQKLAAESFDGPAIVLARAEHVIQLVRRTRDIRVDAYPDQPWPSDLRVSLVVLHNGPSTDVSPTHDLHLALFNLLPEYGTAWALEPVISVYEFQGVERIEAGVYKVTAKRYEVGSDCGFVTSEITVDARQLSVAVRQAKGLAEFDAKRYSVPIGLSMVNTGCAD